MNKKTSLVLLTVLLIAAGVLIYQIVQKKQTDNADYAALSQKVSNEDFGLSFSYQGGPDGFTLVEPPAGQVGILKAYLLLPTKAYDEYKTRETAGEAPAGMNMFIFNLETADAAVVEVGSGTTSSVEGKDRMSRLQEWATTNTAITSYGAAKSAPETVKIDGLPMLHYKADGLYQQDIYLGSYKNKAYMFVGQYNAETDQTYTSFQALMQTVSFD